jgi:hypothetical protein
MRPLVIGPDQLARCAEIRRYAEANVYTMDEMKGVMILGAEVAPGTDERFRCVIPMGFRCVFTLEQQPEPVGLCTHLSVSLADGRPGGCPNPMAMTEIQKAFGLTEEQIVYGHIHTWIEPLDYDPGQAINMLNKVEVTQQWKEEVAKRISQVQSRGSYSAR